MCMAIVSPDRCEHLPRFMFCSAPSLARRVDYLRAPWLLKCANLHVAEPISNMHGEGTQLPQNLHSKSQPLGAAAAPVKNFCKEPSRATPHNIERLNGELEAEECEREAPANRDGQPEQSDQSVAAAANHKVINVATLSAGSQGHNVGTCRPCAYYWKADGCNKGTACEFCHMCEQGMAKYRKKERIASLREAKSPKKPPKIIATMVFALPPGLVRKSTDEHKSNRSSSSDTPSTSNGSSVPSPVSCKAPHFSLPSPHDQSEP